MKVERVSDSEYLVLFGKEAYTVERDNSRYNWNVYLQHYRANGERDRFRLYRWLDSLEDALDKLVEEHG